MSARSRAIALALLMLSLLPLAPACAQRSSTGNPTHAPLRPSATQPLPPAALDPTLAIGGEDVKARETETRLSVDVLVNGRGPYHFVVDSGADTSVVGSRIARDQGLPAATPVIVNGMTGSDLVGRVDVASLTLGPNVVRNLELPVLRESDVGGDGLIGIDALAEQRLMLDFERRLIRVEDARTRWRALPGEIVIVARRRRGQLILTEVRAGGHPVLAVIDTGAEVTVGNTVLRDLLLRRHGQKFETAEMTGVTGVHIPVPMARIGQLQLGPISLEDVPIAFADVPPFALFELSKVPALLLGTDILRTFRRVSLDFRARKVRFQLRSCRSQAIVLSTSQDSAYTRLSSSAANACER